MISYFESAEDIQIDLKRLIHELRYHNVPQQEIESFIMNEIKPREDGLYNAQEVLIWLGY